MAFILGTHFESTQWVNIEPCGFFCGCMTYFLLAYGMYATSTCVIIPWLGYSVFGIVNLVLFNAASLMGMYCHFKTMTTDPGAVPRNAKPLLDDAEENDFEANEKTERFKKFCKRCRGFKPYRAHHCSMCGRCIVKMDHHCPWVNNCVGVGNHKLFLQFLFWVFTSCIYSLILVAAKYVGCLLRGRECNSAFDEHLLVIFLAVEAILFALFTLCMLGDQISSISQGATQIDRLKKTKFKQQTEINEVFGSPAAVYCAWDWIYPIPLQYPNADIRSIILGYIMDGDGTTGNSSGGSESDPLMVCEPVSPIHGKYLARSKTDSNRHLGRNVTALLKKNGQVNGGDISDESNYGEESIQEWGHPEPLVHNSALMNAALHEVELVSDPGSVDVPNIKENSESARLLGSGSNGGVSVGVSTAGNAAGSGSNGSIAGINGNVRKRV